MQNLEQRLTLAMSHGKKSASEIARAARVSPAAISKLLNGKSKEIKAAHAFAIARECQVDAEWLATGRGKAPEAGVKAKREPYNPLAEFEPKHIDLLRMYRRLPPELRTPIRAMIQTLAAAQREGYSTWTREARETEEA